MVERMSTDEKETIKKIIEIKNLMEKAVFEDDDQKYWEEIKKIAGDNDDLMIIATIELVYAYHFPFILLYLYSKKNKIPNFEEALAETLLKWYKKVNSKDNSTK
jgi:hypothetical protein